MTYRLVPRPGGYYDRVRAALDADLDYLFDGDTHAECDDDMYCPRQDVLIERIPEVEAIYEHEFR